MTQAPRASARTALVIWASLLVAMLLYGAIGVLVATRPAPGGFQPPPPAVVYAISGAAAVLGITSLVLWRVLASPERIVATCRAARPEATAEALGQDAVNAWQRGHIVAWAMADGAALMGLVVAILTRQALVLVPFVLLGTILLAIMFPRDAALRAKLHAPPGR